MKERQLPKYKAATKSYSEIIKDYVPDRITVEVGDSKDASAFYPQVKVMRWGDETNVSYRLDASAISGTESVTTEGDKVIWSKGDVEGHFYALTGSNDPTVDRQGAYEFDVILKKKPASNVLTFTLQTKEVDFFYHPQLTQKLIDQGHRQPENAIGSYAVYHKTKRDNYVGGKEYKTGKMGHIYRPLVTDGNGRTSWGVIGIDLANNLLTITTVQPLSPKHPPAVVSSSNNNSGLQARKM